jgi:hypothetical protein
MSLKDETVGIVATPEDFAALQRYIQRFSMGERVVASTCAFMAWNLACKIAQQEHDAREAGEE